MTFVSFKTRNEANLFITIYEARINEMIGNEDYIVEYIDPIACPAIGGGVLYHILVKTEDGGEYWVRKSDVDYMNKKERPYG